MEEIKLSDYVIEQIKDFNHKKLTKEQILLIDKLILNEELKKCYKEYGLCKECKQIKTSSSWCQSCNAKYFQQNFKNWTSGNHYIDEFIQNVQLKAKSYKEVLEWIDYNRFENVEHLAKGGFGTVYKAIWKDGHIGGMNYNNNQWIRCGKDLQVALKSLHNSQDITVEFLREVGSHIIVNNAKHVVHCYGITKNPETNNFIIVMQYAKRGNLRQYLNNNFNSLSWVEKLRILINISSGLENIHNHGLIHHDFHCGNILDGTDSYYISDLGLCQPANVKSSDKKIYGVLPYVAPEILKGKEYTQASDIYAFGIIANEVYTGLPPYHDIAHDEFLTISICQGLRPKSKYKIPQLILDVIKQCWDVDPLKRPKIGTIRDLLDDLYYDIYNSDSLFHKQCEEADKINKQLSSGAALSSSIGLSYTTHPQAVYTSKLLNFKNLPEPKNESEYSESMEIDFILDSKDESN